MADRTTLVRRLKAKLRLPVMAGPMFIASTPDLVIEQCKAGIIGSMPALNPRTTEDLDADIARIAANVGDVPYAINLVAHKSNSRLGADLDVVLKHKVPIVVLALAANPDLVRQLQENGALVFQDVVKDRHAHKCAEMGVDGIIAVGAGAGGHTGDRSPFALMHEIREWWDGLVLLSGAIATGRGVLAAEVLGADFAYIGSAFLASTEANTAPAFKKMITDHAADDIVVTNCFTGVNANFLRPSILEHGLDPAKLVRPEGKAINIDGGGDNAKAWKDIWSAGQGIGAIKRAEPAGDYIDRLVEEYAGARKSMGMSPYAAGQ